MTGATNATDAEKQAAIELGYAIRDFLAGLGWPLADRDRFRQRLPSALLDRPAKRR